MFWFDDSVFFSEDKDMDYYNDYIWCGDPFLKAEMLKEMRQAYIKRKAEEAQMKTANKPPASKPNQNLANKISSNECKETIKEYKNKYENEITILMEDFEEFKSEYTQLFGAGFRNENQTSKLESEIIDACIYNMYSLHNLLNLHKEIIKNKKF